MKHDGNDLLRRQDCIEAIEGITCSMSLCVNADECHGMQRMRKQAVIELANMPAVQPDHNADVSKKVSISYGHENDVISREAAIEALARMMPRSYTPDGSHPADEEIFRAQEVFADCIEALEILPSAQPETHWIPCSERMPEEREWIGTKTFGTTISDEVYVTFESPKGERFTKHLSFQNGKVSSFTQREIDVFYKGAVPIAWMPLPEPYRGGEKE